MGKARIQSISKIQDKSKLNVTFQKRKRGLLKKAIELSSLCDMQTLMFIYDKQKNSLVQYQSHTDFDLTSTCKLFSQAAIMNLHIEKYANDDYDIMDQERIKKDDSKRAIQSIDIVIADAQKKLNNFQGQIDTILSKSDTILCKRPSINNTEELKKSLSNYKEDAMMKVQKHEDYFLNDFDFDPQQLKPLTEHSVTEPSVIDEPQKSHNQILRYNLHNPPQEPSQRQQYCNLIAKQEHREETTSLFNLRTSTNESDFQDKHSFKFPRAPSSIKSGSIKSHQIDILRELIQQSNSQQQHNAH